MSYNLHTTCCYIGSHRRDDCRGMLVQLLSMRTCGKHPRPWDTWGTQHGRESRTCWQISYHWSSLRNNSWQPKHTSLTQHNSDKGLPVTSTSPWHLRVSLLQLLSLLEYPDESSTGSSSPLCQRVRGHDQWPCMSQASAINKTHYPKWCSSL